MYSAYLTCVMCDSLALTLSTLHGFDAIDAYLGIHDMAATLEEFERQLASSKSRNDDDDYGDREAAAGNSDRKHHREHRSRHRDGHGHAGREKRHRHRSRHRDDNEQRHRHKRRHRDRDHDDDNESRRKRHQSHSPREVKHGTNQDTAAAVKALKSDDNDDGDWAEKESAAAPAKDGTKAQRDAWMQDPAALEVDYVQRTRPKSPPGQFVGAKQSRDFKVTDQQFNEHLAELQNDCDSNGDDDAEKVKDEPAQHYVKYTFGDNGSSWRMTKLKGVYRKAEETGMDLDVVAEESYGDLRLFDDAREEEREVNRRAMYGKEYIGRETPSGELFAERKLRTVVRRETEDKGRGAAYPADGGHMRAAKAPLQSAPFDQSALNKLKAQLIKAKLMNASNVAQLEEEYTLAETAFLAHRAHPGVVVLNDMENRMLAGDRSGEVTALTGKRALERGTVQENEDMSIEEMVKQEKRTRGANGGEGRAFAERIAKDGKFKDDLEYMDDNAAHLSKRVVKSDTNLRNAAVGDFQRMQRTLDNCPLCYHEDSSAPPVAPVLSLATRTYMTLATEPEMAKHGAVVVPIQHRLNLLECDDDEWEEIRNFMKSLTRFYHAQDKSVIFYENAAHMHSRKGHAALMAVPLPHHLAENAPAYFKEAVLASDEQWSQHKPIIDTLALTQKAGYGKAAFRRAMVKEMPYFHVFYTLDGGMGHVIEDERRWPKGDLFAREVLGGMLDKGPEVIKKQGRWERHDRRVDSFKKKWDPFDWTKVLMEAP